MISLGGGRTVSHGIRGHDDQLVSKLGTVHYRHYENDVPEPRNYLRDKAIADRITKDASLQGRQYEIQFHQRLRSPFFEFGPGKSTLIKSAMAPRSVAALAMSFPPSVKRVTWQIRVGSLEVLGGNPLSVPSFRVGIVSRHAARRLNFEQCELGEDENSWGIQAGKLTLYKCHGGFFERVTGVNFQSGDVVTSCLDLIAGTLAFRINDEEPVTPFSGIRGPVVPAVSASGDTAVSVTIENCRNWPD